jgi:hypothetical protein
LRCRRRLIKRLKIIRRAYGSYEGSKDVMVDVFDFPHVPYWFSLRQAIGIAKKSLLTSEKCHHPMAILVFDEKYNLMGTLTLKDILKGLEPNFLKPITKAQGLESDEAALSMLWDGLFFKESLEKATRPVGKQWSCKFLFSRMIQ